MKFPTKQNNLSLHLISKEFDYEANKPLTPENFTLHSGKKIWWKCDKGHEWKASINSRTGFNRGCPYCWGRLPTKETCLSKTHPHLLLEWSYNKNSVKPTEVSFGSKKKVWWKCEKGHEWKAIIANRATKHNKNKCPYCCGRLPTKENNLSLHPVSKEFHLEKNHPLIPKNFLPKSNKKIWWKCEKGHEWKSSIASRTHLGRSCKKCSNNISKLEKDLYNWCCETFPEIKIEPNKKGLLENKKFEIDIYFPELNKGIEFNGNYYHSFPEVVDRDKRKLLEAKEKEIKLLIVWEDEWIKNKEKIRKEIIDEIYSHKRHSHF